MTSHEPSRLDRIESALERLERLQTADRESMLQLTLVVQSIAETIQRQAEQAERDRNQAAIDRAEFRTTVQDILSVLSERFRANGINDG